MLILINSWKAVTKMVQEAFTYVDQIHDMERKLQLIDTLRTVSSGKVIIKFKLREGLHKVSF
jgi:hypothetical protein